MDKLHRQAVQHWWFPFVAMGDPSRISDVRRMKMFDFLDAFDRVCQNIKQDAALAGAKFT